MRGSFKKDFTVCMYMVYTLQHIILDFIEILVSTEMTLPLYIILKGALYMFYILQSSFRICLHHTFIWYILTVNALAYNFPVNGINATRSESRLDFLSKSIPFWNDHNFSSTWWSPWRTSKSYFANKVLCFFLIKLTFNVRNWKNSVLPISLPEIGRTLFFQFLIEEKNKLKTLPKDNLKIGFHLWSL